MQPRIGSATVLLVASWIASAVVASSAYNALASSQSVSAKPTIPIIVTKAEFGILQVKSKKNVTFLPTNKIPLIEGNRYGWRIQLKDYQGEVTWREILQLPKHPDTWGTTDGEHFSIVAHGTEGVTTRTQLIKNGIIQDYWTVVSGDPIGKHKIDIYISERRIASFEFETIPVKR
ncbi:MAG: hypothetical protein PUP92_05920 [Rhizonema sp. PD38]|nr:hypothetical protein [Rhizonema sp. PD38]